MRSAPIFAKGVLGEVYKSTLDCVNGYHGIPLAEKERDKTTFATEWGKFRYTEAHKVAYPQGTANNEYTDGL